VCTNVNIFTLNKSQASRRSELPRSHKRRFKFNRETHSEIFLHVLLLRKKGI